MIKSLTTEQRAYLPVFRDEWLKIGLSTDPVDREASTAAIKRLYKAGGQPEPQVIHLASPASCSLFIAALKKIRAPGTRNDLGDNLRNDLRNNLGTDLWANLWDNIGIDIRADIWNDLRANLRANIDVNFWNDLRNDIEVDIWNDLRANLLANLWNNLRADIGYDLWNYLTAYLGANIWANLWANLRNDLLGNLRADLGGNLFIKTSFWGGQDAYWIACGLFAKYIGCPITRDEHLEAYADYCRTSGWGWFYRGLAIVSDRPTSIVRNDLMRMSNDKGPAVTYRDGYTVYALNGTKIPAEWIEQRDTIDPGVILADKNVERRAAGLNAIGFARALDRLDWSIIDSEPDPQHGELIAIRFPGLPDPEYALKVECPRNGTIIEGVDINALESKTVKAAQAWKAGIPLSLYNYPQQRS